jgi:hypothetical protein
MAWNSWEPLGGASPGDLRAVSYPGHRLNVVVRGTDNQLYHKWRDIYAPAGWQPSPTGWDSLAGNLASTPALVSIAVDSVHAFAVLSDATVRHRWWDGKVWNPWETLGGKFAAGPGVLAAVSWGQSRLDVFGVAQDQTIQHAWWEDPRFSSTPGWHAWDSLGGSFQTNRNALTAVSWGAGRLDVFAVGVGGFLEHTFFEAGATVGFAPWELLSGPWGFNSVAAACWAPPHIELFGIADGGEVYHLLWDATLKSGWQSAESSKRDAWGQLVCPIPGLWSIAPGSLAAVSTEPYHVSVFAIANADGSVYHNAWFGWGKSPSSGRWKGWEPVAGGKAAAEPFALAATASDTHRVDVFVVGTDKSMWHTYGALENRRDMLPSGSMIFPGDALVTDSGRLKLAMQADGNLVLYGPPGVPVWSSGTAGRGIYARMNEDGDFAVYGLPGLFGVKIWDTGTHQPASFLLLYDEDAGGARVIRGWPYEVEWQSTPLIPADRIPPKAGDRLGPGEGLVPGEQLTSKAGVASLVFRIDGEIALESRALGTLWVSPVVSQPWQVVMQHDGNFVEYSTNALPGFATGTSSAVPVSLIVQEDSVVIRDSLSGYDIWRKPDSAPPPPPPGAGTLLVDMALATPGVDEGHIGYAIDVSGSGFFAGSIQQVDVYDATVAEIRFVKPGKSAPDDCGNDGDVIKRGNGGSLSRSDLDTLGNTDPKRLYLAACATRTGEWLNKSTGKPLPIQLLLHHS